VSEGFWLALLISGWCTAVLLTLVTISGTRSVIDELHTVQRTLAVTLQQLRATNQRLQAAHQRREATEWVVEAQRQQATQVGRVQAVNQQLRGGEINSQRLGDSGAVG